MRGVKKNKNNNNSALNYSNIETCTLVRGYSL